MFDDVSSAPSLLTTPLTSQLQRMVTFVWQNLGAMLTEM